MPRLALHFILVAWYVCYAHPTHQKPDDYYRQIVLFFFVFGVTQLGKAKYCMCTYIFPIG